MSPQLVAARAATEAALRKARSAAEVIASMAAARFSNNRSRFEAESISQTRRV